jgi:hypothetical protein
MFILKFSQFSEQLSLQPAMTLSVQKQKGSYHVQQISRSYGDSSLG